jgi:hypothetical protein
MIRDAQRKAEIKQQWAALKKLCQESSSFALVGGGVQFNTPDEHFNLPLLLAYSVLDEVLSELIAEGVFNSPSPKLEPKMVASQGALSWQNYQLVDDGRKTRNKLAHEAKLAGKADCLKFVRAIETELKEWNVI